MDKQGTHKFLKGPRLSRAQFLKVTAAGAAASALPFAAGHAQAPAMATKPIPKSANGEELPVIGLGTNRFGRLSSDDEKARGADVIQALVGGGGTVVDTAEGYGDSEAVLGEIFDQTNTHDRVFIATKLGKESREDGIATMEESFKRLRTDTIDLMMVHNMRATDIQLPIMQEWKAAGRFRYVGISHSNPDEQEELDSIIANGNIDFVQFNYSVDVRQPEERLLPLAADNGVAVMVNLPLGRGRLLEQVEDQPFPEWAREELNCETYAQLLLKFVASHPAVNVAIPGTTTPRYMVENCIAGHDPLADEKQRERIAAIWDA